MRLRALVCLVSISLGCSDGGGGSGEPGDFVFPDVGDLRQPDGGGEDEADGGSDGGPITARDGSIDGFIPLPSDCEDNPADFAMAFSAPRAGQVIIGSSVQVAITITSAGLLPVEASEVNTWIVVGEDPEDVIWTPMYTQDNELFTATLGIGALAPGAHTINVAAPNVEGVASCVSRDFVYDPGPIIDIQLPNSGQSFKDVMTYVFNVETGAASDCFDCANAACCGDDDVECACGGDLSESVCCLALDGTVEIGVADKKFVDFTVVSGVPPIYSYTGSIDFSGDFDPDLIGQSLFTVTATDYYGATTTATASFIVDQVGPTIAILAPLAGEIVAGFFQVDATITDAAGVNDATVVASVNGIPLSDFGEADAGQFEGLFDIGFLPGCDVSPQIEISAQDLLGNPSTMSQVIHVDSMPPVGGLDPREDARYLKDGEIELEDGTTEPALFCSHDFDPVGFDAVDDGDCRLQVFEIRARIEDRTGSCPGAEFSFISQIDDDNVELFAYQGADDLVVDLNGDGYCDAINPDISAYELAVTNLAPIAPGGEPDYTFDPGGYPFDCVADIASDVPDDFCETSPGLTRVVDHQRIADVPAIYSIPPVLGDSDLQCLGQEYDSGDFGSGLVTGWTCFALRFRDKVGNVGISKPIRVFVDDTGVSYGAQLDSGCAFSAFDPSSICTGQDEFNACGASFGCCDEADFTVGAMPDCGWDDDPDPDPEPGQGCEFRGRATGEGEPQQYFLSEDMFYNGNE